MPRLSRLCRCAEVPGSSQNPLARSCQRCAIRCSAPAVHLTAFHPAANMSPFSTGPSHLSLHFQLIPLRYDFFFCLLCSPHQRCSGCLFMYLCVVVFFLSLSVWFCFLARSSGELGVWLKCVDWCCCGATPFRSSPLSSMVAAACETRSTRILCMKGSHILLR